MTILLFVIMDKNENISACEDVLNDKTTLPNLNCREELQKIFLETEENNFLSKANSRILGSEGRKPVFYGFSRITK